MKRIVLFISLSIGLLASAKAQYVNILSVNTIPSTPSDTSDIKVVVSSEFGTGSCSLTTVVSTSSNDTLYLGLLYQTGMLTFICGSTDTVDLGVLPCIAHVLSVTVVATGGTNGSATSAVPLNISCTGVGVSEPNFTDDILIYPAHTTGELNVKSTAKKFSPLKISILNLLGNTIYVADESLTENNPVKRIDVSAFPKGIYLIKVESSAGSRIRKFVKEE